MPKQNSENRIDVVYLGPPKTGSTWLYHCFKEHPELAVATTDSTHYLDKRILQADNAYMDIFGKPRSNQVVVDMCQDYFTTPRALERAKNINPQMKFIVCIREPISRAFSHYWHLKKQQVLQDSFDLVLQRHYLFQTLIEPGFYHYHISRIYDHFPEKQVKIVYFDDLKKDAGKYLADILEFVGVDETFQPEVLDMRINAAGHKKNTGTSAIAGLGKLLEKVGLYKLVIWAKKKGLVDSIKSLVSSKTEYEQGPSKSIKDDLLRVLEPERRKLEKLLKKELSDWTK